MERVVSSRFFKEGVLPTSARGDRGSPLRACNSLRQLSTCIFFGDRKGYDITLQSLLDVMADASHYAPFQVCLKVNLVEYSPGFSAGPVGVKDWAIIQVLQVWEGGDEDLRHKSRIMFELKAAALQLL
jgi:hypothetical protein